MSLHDGAHGTIVKEFSYQCFCYLSINHFLSVLRIRIRIGNSDPDSGARNLTKINKQTRLPAFKNGFYTYVFFYVKIQLFVTAESTRIRIRNSFALRIRIEVKIRIRIRIETNTDTQQYFSL